ncbi:unnamed protein product [Polarella glacialis]|uniref:Uncharacterized protein n=1 Tax=Polarella glacialis TaxID=89957 RepID=A0A813LLL9_POLGL|nr:unnamed protein product [Polarella glacialis]
MHGADLSGRYGNPSNEALAQEMYHLHLRQKCRVYLSVAAFTKVCIQGPSIQKTVHVKIDDKTPQSKNNYLEWIPTTTSARTVKDKGFDTP